MRKSLLSVLRRRSWYAVAAASAALPVLAFLPSGSAAASTARAAQGDDGVASWIGQVKWTSQDLAPGVTVRSGVLADSSAKPYWTVTLDATVTSSITGEPADAELGTASWATATAGELKADGYTPNVTVVDWPQYSDGPRGVEGYRVRTGDFSTQAAATALATTLKGLGFTTATVEWTGYSADQAPDDELIHEAVINPRLSDIEVTHDGVLAHTQTTSSVGAALGALVDTNGGFFVTTATSGIVGAPAGLAVYDGKLESINAGPRAALIIDNGRPEIADVEADVTVHAGSASYPINGINRIPGVDLQCGRPGGEPTSQPRQDINCTVSSELVLFTDDLGTTTPSGSGTQAVIGADGRVLSVGAQTGGDVPAGGFVIQGIGAAGTWLAQHAVVGQRLAVSERLATTSGQPIPLNPGLSIASASPILVKNGKVAIDAVSEGDVVPADLSFNYSWAEERQARTIVGINAEGDLLLVTVDGSQPGISEGATLSEEAALMKNLGAVSAMNLDGGGSTAFAVNGTQVNSPAYATGERLVGDFVAVLPKSHS
ncbi:MAG TPA: phosphodiester glycosidase family protein [Trebonia sp.]|jgi:hypothetical protein|nr:phosphodiester glycosidase family protein [Trebonia sp.]